MPSSAKLLRTFMPLAILMGCFSLLGQKLAPADFATLPQTVKDMPLSAFGLCAMFTAISLWAVGRYDVVAHRHLQTGQPPGNARRAGTIAIALSQTLGFGLFTGALARWRMLPDLTTTDALRLSTFVSLSFMASLGLVTAASMLFLRAPAFGFWPALIVMISLPFLCTLLFWRPIWRIGTKRLHLPSLPGVAAIVLWTLVDTLAAAAAFYVLLQPFEFGFDVFFPVFLLSLAAGLMTGTPGGLGPFELTMFALLPYSPPASLLTALVTYRVIYYACPDEVGGSCSTGIECAKVQLSSTARIGATQ